MLIDLHCHTAPLSACSALRPEEVVDLARERGLDGVCFTEHDRWWDATALDDLANRTGFPLFAGVELTVSEGHFLGFGLGPTTAISSLAMVAEAAEATRGLLYLAHPARDTLTRLSPALAELCQSIETINGSDSPLVNTAAQGLVANFALPGIGGSDCHRAAEVGRAATRFERRIASTRELVSELRAGRYSACYL